MRKIILLFVLLLFAGITENFAQPVLYGLTSEGGESVGDIIKFETASNTLSGVYAFPSNSRSPRFHNNLIQATDNKLYGMTSQGGSSNLGAIFSIDPVTKIKSKIFDFNNTNGGLPNGSLVQTDDGKLYGMTTQGGNYGVGTIFSFDPLTNNFIKLHDFNGTNGSYPFGSLLLAIDGKLYGMTSRGGANSNGIIFSFDPGTNSYIKLYDFNNINGSVPYGSLIQVPNGKLYGMTVKGGNGDFGTIFSFDPQTNIHTKLFDFNNINGSLPYGDLLQSIDGNLYGMTSKGGNSGFGTIFSFDLNTNNQIKLHDFDNTNGSNPNGSLTLAPNGKLFGMTFNSAGLSGGTIFSFDPLTKNHSLLYELNSSNGTKSQGSFLLANDGKLYGMTGRGGNSNFGTIFSFDPVTYSFNKFNDFNNTNGSYPSGSLVKAKDRKLYGMTKSGGFSGVGTIFSYDPVTEKHIKLIDFNVTNGAFPKGSLVESDGKLYGMTGDGGTNGLGTIFSYNPVSNTYIKLFDFNLTQGAFPYGSLVVYGGKLYGMTSEGGNSVFGTIFCYDPATNTYSKIFNFNGINGAYPFGNLVVFGGKLYGLTNQGGSSGNGTIFSFDPASEMHVKLFDFSGPNGRIPQGSLIVSSGKLYGMTYQGGISNNGTIFSFDPNTNIHAKLFDFNNTNGTSPLGSLVASGDKLYGMTSGGGSSGAGVIFSFDIVSNNYTKLQDFNKTNGALPRHCALIEVCINGNYTYFKDDDGDGFGDPAASLKDCFPPPGYVSDNTDNCPSTYNPDQLDNDFDGIGDVCDNENRLTLNSSSECLPNVSLNVSNIADADKIEWYRNGVLIKTVIPIAAPGGLTIAGGNGTGNANNQLNYPYGVTLDKSGNIYVADTYNYRVQKFVPGSTTGATLFSTDYTYTSDIFIDSKGIYYIPDQVNNLVAIYVPGASFINVIGGNGQGAAANQFYSSVGVHVDAVGNIYVADYNNHRIQKWAPGSNTGITVAGGNGPGSASNQLNSPQDIFVDENNNLYVVDKQNHRIQKWAQGASSGVTVAGGNGQGSGANQLNSPNDVFIDKKGYIIIADAGNNRIQRWAPGETSGITVAGGNGFGSAANQLANPAKLFLGSAGEIFLCDSYNDRIQKWSSPTISSIFNPTLQGIYTAVVKRNGLNIPTTPVTINGLPSITPKGSLEVNTDAGKNTATIIESQLLTNVEFDVNDASIIVFSPTTGILPIGTTEITATATNACGSATAKFNVIVSDKENPTIVCAPNISVKADDGKCIATLILSSPITDDNVGISSITSNAPASFTIGTTTVKWIVTDNSGNTNTCDQIVTVTANPEICNGIDDDCDGLIDEGCNTVSLPNINISNTLVLEGSSGLSNASFIVRLSSPSSSAVTVQYQTSNGTALNLDDYLAKSGSVTFPPNSLSQTITIQVKGDRLNEAIENFRVLLSNPLNANITNTSATCTIINDDLYPSIRIEDLTVTESSQVALVKVSLTSASGQIVRVLYNTQDGTAFSGSDYTPTINGQIVFQPGETVKFINVLINADNQIENTEAFIITLKNPEFAFIQNIFGGRRTANINIQNSDLSTSMVKNSAFEKLDFKDQISSLEVKILPNPSRNYFQINILSSQKGIIQLRVTDILGRVVEERKVERYYQPIQMGQNWHNGTYILEVIQGNERKTIQMVKLK